MFALSHKSKQYLLVLLKIFILVVTFRFIYLKISQHESLSLSGFYEHIFENKNALFYILLFLLLAASNWFFEILKWKTLVSETQNISFFAALKQSLASLTVSLATPNRIGEYGAKAYFFEKNKRKNILLLNFFHNSFQMAVTIFFGLIGLFIVFFKYKINFLPEITSIKIFIVFLILSILLIIGIIFRKQQLIFKGLTISKVIRRFKSIPFYVKSKMMLFSVARYLIFCFLFFKLLSFFGVSISLSEAFPLLFLMYLLVSVVPSVFIFDVIIRGGAAVWLFSLAGVSEIPILSTVLGMWILNFVIPSVFGSYFLISYKPKIR